ncbi:MAG TPA: HD domain-containing phosphohydrolase [Pyrinomonadaceae bacterium]|jgi:HD-GYP domain-containing protein (c-di-GMP phosphodiesterase class II)
MSSIHLEFAESERVAAEAFIRLSAAIDEFEGYAHPHALRVAKLADEMAKLFRLARADRSSLRFAALLHDMGEMTMKRDYIRRAAPLTSEERLDLARHPVIGEQESARAGADRGAQLLVRWHHEWWNGAGYPDALRQEQIPLAARILRVADSYSALTDERPFRPAGTVEEARRHLTQWAGLEFDPQVVRVFLSLEGFAELRSYAQQATTERASAASAVSGDDAASAPPEYSEQQTEEPEAPMPAATNEQNASQTEFGRVPPEF